MKKHVAYTGLLIGGLATVLISQTTWAQSLNSYLEDKSDGIVHVQLVTPPEALQGNQTFWGKLRLLLGIRKVTRIKPPIGTKFIVQASAYASSPYQTDSTPCITAAGTRVRPGVVATNFLPLGTLLEINGEEFIVEDRMNTRYDGYYLDLWFPSTSSALKFGRRNINIVVTGYGDPGQQIRVVEEEPEKDEKVVETEETIWNRFTEQLASISELLGARRAGNVDQYDVDCIDENV